MEHNQGHCQACEGEIAKMSQKWAVFESYWAFMRFALPIGLGVAGLLIGRLL